MKQEAESLRRWADTDT